MSTTATPYVKPQAGLAAAGDRHGRMKPRIVPFAKPFMIGKELEYIASAVASGSIAGGGTFTARCHEWLERHLRARKALLTHSCTAALEMAAILLDLAPGDEVIMPSFTFVSTANAFVLRGARPVFVDIRPDTLNIDESLIEAAITDRTRGIVPVHYAGIGCEMDRIMAIAERHGLKVVEDAAQGLLSTYGEKSLGTIGHLGCLSFHETKNVICGEGGALLVNDPELAQRAEIIWEKGTNRSQFFRGEVDKYRWVDIGSSFLPDELAAAFLLAQLEAADMICARRLILFDAYFEKFSRLAEAGHVRLPNRQQRGRGNGHIFHFLTASAETRAALLTHLRKRGIGAVFHYVPLHDSPAGLRYGRASGSLEVTSELSSRLVRMPMYFEMTLDEVDYVVDAVEQFFGEAQPT